MNRPIDIEEKTELNYRLRKYLIVFNFWKFLIFNCCYVITLMSDKYISDHNNVKPQICKDNSFFKKTPIF